MIFSVGNVKNIYFCEPQQISSIFRRFVYSDSKKLHVVVLLDWLLFLRCRKNSSWTRMVNMADVVLPVGNVFAPLLVQLARRSILRKKKFVKEQIKLRKCFRRFLKVSSQSQNSFVCDPCLVILRLCMMETKRFFAVSRTFSPSAIRKYLKLIEPGIRILEVHSKGSSEEENRVLCEKIKKISPDFLILDIGRRASFGWLLDKVSALNAKVGIVFPGFGFKYAPCSGGMQRVWYFLYNSLEILVSLWMYVFSQAVFVSTFLPVLPDDCGEHCDDGMLG